MPVGWGQDHRQAPVAPRIILQPQVLGPTPVMEHVKGPSFVAWLRHYAPRIQPLVQLRLDVIGCLTAGCLPPTAAADRVKFHLVFTHEVSSIDGFLAAITVAGDQYSVELRDMLAGGAVENRDRSAAKSEEETGG